MPEPMTEAELAELADELLRQDARRECCRECGDYGEPTGRTTPVAQDYFDAAGRQLVLHFPELGCGAGHRWHAGEGRPRSIAGPNPILLEEHLRERRSREIYTEIGTPDPSIVRGLYFRAHPEGRKLSSAAQRRDSAAGFFR
jgi:hypothetical protein